MLFSFQLQNAFARGELQSGTYKEITPKEKHINDVSGLEAKLKNLDRSELSWLERLDITVPQENTPAEEDDETIHDDFKRELYL